MAHRITDRTKRLVLYIVIFFVIWTIRATVLFSIDKNISSPVIGQIYADLLRVFVWVIPVFAYVGWIDKEKPLKYLRLDTLGNTKALVQAALVVIFYFAAVLLIDSLLVGHPLRFTIQPLSNSWIKTFLVLSIGPIAEEILYRGFFLQKLQSSLNYWKSNLITSGLFVAIHWPNWLYTGKPASELGILSIQVFALSILLGYLMQKTESLWPSIFTHILNNMVSFFIVG